MTESIRKLSTCNYNFTCVFLISVIYFLGLPWEIVFSVVTDNYIYFEHFDINGLNILVQGFCPLALEIKTLLDFLMDSVFKTMEIIKPGESWSF